MFKAAIFTSWHHGQCVLSLVFSFTVAETNVSDLCMDATYGWIPSLALSPACCVCACVFWEISKKKYFQNLQEIYLKTIFPYNSYVLGLVYIRTSSFSSGLAIPLGMLKQQSFF